MEIVKFLKKNFKFIVIFCLILIFNLICNPVNLDEVWNYGFANNLYRGLVPYRDFNMVLTPFYAFFMALPFWIFGSNMLVFHITNALIITICFILIEKMYGEKMWLVLLFSLFPFDFCFPNYNMFLFILLCTLIYLEKNCVTDNNKWIHYLIGFLLGVAVLTKQTVGGCLVLVSFYYIKDFKNILKRIVGFIIPITIFLVYLISNKAFFDFINLCILGLIDFSGNNQGINVFLVFYLLMLIYIVLKIRRDRKNIEFYYVLAFFSIAIPIVDFFHIAYVFLAVLLVFLETPRKKIFHYATFSIASIVILGIMTLSFNEGIPFKNYPNDLKHFEYRFVNPESYKFTKEVSSFLEENKDKRVVFLSANAYYFKIVNDLDCTYLDLINRGNWGYHGGERILNEVKKEAKRKTIFLLNEDELAEISQTDSEALTYVIKHAKKIGSIRIYDIYQFE